MSRPIAMCCQNSLLRTANEASMNPSARTTGTISHSSPRIMLAARSAAGSGWGTGLTSIEGSLEDGWSAMILLRKSVYQSSASQRVHLHAGGEFVDVVFPRKL